MIQLGYCCINRELSARGIRTNRSMQKARFLRDQQLGLVETSQMALQNARDLLTILEWNRDHHIWLFRVSMGNLFPFGDTGWYRLEDLPDWMAIHHALQNAGRFALMHNMRITSHPSHFVKLASVNPTIVASSIASLEHEHTVMALMGLPTHRQFCLNIHVGASDGADVRDRFLEGVSRLSDGARERLVVENDDRPNGFSVRRLLQFVDLPITFDHFHHSLFPDGMTAKDAANVAATTWWPHTPLQHYSESKREQEGSRCSVVAHADLILQPFDSYVHADVEVEAKHKETAVLHYRKLYPDADRFSTPHHDFS